MSFRIDVTVKFKARILSKVTRANVLALILNSYMILWLLAYSNINRNTVRLSNLYSLTENALWSLKRLYDFYASSSCLHVAFTDASPREALCYACTMLVRNHHEMNFSPFELSPRTVKNSRIIQLFCVYRVLRLSNSLEFWQYPYLPVSTTRH